MATYGVQQFGNFLVRQAQEKKDPKELELTKAALTAAGTAPIGYFADRFTLGLGGPTKKIGEQILKELSARQLAGEVGKGVVGGATKGIIAESPTEVLEQAAERYQAGLSLTGPDAMSEYKNAFFGAAAAGGGIGGVSGGVQGYADTRTGLEPGTNQPGISSINPQGTPTGRIRTTDQTGLDFSGGRTEESIRREAELNASLVPLQTKLKEVDDYVRDLSAINPQDERIASALDFAKTLHAQATQLKAQIETEVQAPQKVTAFNAPAQEGFDFNAPEGAKTETKAQPSLITPIEEQEFGLLPPEGKVAPATLFEPIQTPKYETSKFMFVTPNADPFKSLNNFFSSVKPAAVSESEARAHQTEVAKLLEDIKNFQQDAVGKDRSGRLNTVRNFFDQFNIAPESLLSVC
jgi:hypothetical protein